MAAADISILRLAAAAERCGVSLSTFRRVLRADPTFPTPVQVAPGISGFRDDEITAWLMSRPRAGQPGTRDRACKAEGTIAAHDQTPGVSEFRSSDLAAWLVARPSAGAPSAEER